MDTCDTAFVTGEAHMFTCPLPAEEEDLFADMQRIMDKQTRLIQELKEEAARKEDEYLDLRLELSCTEGENLDLREELSRKSTENVDLREELTRNANEILDLREAHLKRSNEHHGQTEPLQTHLNLGTTMELILFDKDKDKTVEMCDVQAASPANAVLDERWIIANPPVRGSMAVSIAHWLRASPIGSTARIVDWRHRTQAEAAAMQASAQAAMTAAMMASAEAEAAAAEPIEPPLVTATADSPLRENSLPQDNPPPRRSGRNKASKKR